MIKIAIVWSCREIGKGLKTAPAKDESKIDRAKKREKMAVENQRTYQRTATD